MKWWRHTDATPERSAAGLKGGSPSTRFVGMRNFGRARANRIKGEIARFCLETRASPRVPRQSSMNANPLRRSAERIPCTEPRRSTLPQPEWRYDHDVPESQSWFRDAEAVAAEARWTNYAFASCRGATSMYLSRSIVIAQCAADNEPRPGAQNSIVCRRTEGGPWPRTRRVP